MSDLTNKVISSNFQRLLQISESGAIADGTGSAFGLKISGSNIAINTSPADGIDLAVAGTISASIISASTGVFGADTVFIGGVQMSENTDGGVTFRDSGSNELGAFQGDGYFILSSSLESGGSGRPLFNLTQQVGTVQNNNVMQVDLTSMKFIIGNVGQHGQWKFGANKSGSNGEGDFFINPSFTLSPSPDSAQTPSLYISQSTKNISLGGIYPNDVNKLSIGGSVFISGSSGHVTASGNIISSGTISGSNLSGTNTGDQDLSGLALKTEVSGAFTSDSASLSTRVSANEVVTAKTLVSSSIQLINSFLEITGDNVVSSSTQIADDISGSFTAVSSSFSTRVSANEVVTAKTLVSSSNQLTSSFLEITGDNVVSSSAQISSDISGSFVQPSSSFSTRVTTLEGNVGQAVNTNSDVTFNNINVGHITSSGNISSSGNVTTNILTTSSFGSVECDTIQHLGDTNTKMTFGSDEVIFRVGGVDMITLDESVSTNADKITFNAHSNNFSNGHITASGNIISSGTISGSNISGTNTGDQDISNLAVTGSDVRFSNITSSKAKFTNLPTSEASVTTGELFTLSGSQLPFDSGSFGSAQRALFNSVSSSKFVLIK